MINFKTFGGNNAVAAAVPTTAATARVKAQLWINIGYLTDQKDESGELRFVSLGQGIALDTIETLPVNSKSTTFAMFQAARNDLRDQLVEEAKSLKPGEAVFTDPIPGFYGLQIQIRRVSEETIATVGEGNPFARKLVSSAGV